MNLFLQMREYVLSAVGKIFPAVDEILSLARHKQTRHFYTYKNTEMLQPSNIIKRNLLVILREMAHILLSFW
jgi:hypothetical protein